MFARVATLARFFISLPFPIFKLSLSIANPVDNDVVKEVLILGWQEHLRNGYWGDEWRNLLMKIFKHNWKQALASHLGPVSFLLFLLMIVCLIQKPQRADTILHLYIFATQSVCVELLNRWHGTFSRPVSSVKFVFRWELFRISLWWICWRPESNRGRWNF